MDISIIHISNSNNDSTKRGTGGRGGGGEKMGLVADLNMHVGGGGGGPSTWSDVFVPRGSYPTPF